MSTIFIEEAGSPLWARASREDAFTSYVMEAEDSTAKGGRHRPFIGPSGRRLIGYGHAILPDERFTDLDEQGAKDLLKQDLEKARAGAMRVHGPRWMMMSDRDKNIATDFVFSMGVSAYKKNWPKLQRALERGEEETIRRESIRGYTPKGKSGLKPVSRRNRLFRQHFFEGGYPVRAFGR